MADDGKGTDLQRVFVISSERISMGVPQVIERQPTSMQADGNRVWRFHVAVVG